MAEPKGITPEEIEEFDRYVARGLGPLLNVHAMYTLAEVGSLQEQQTEDALDEMIQEITQNHPEKAGHLIAGLLALVFALRSGQSIHEFFEGTSQFVYPLMEANNPTAPPR